MARIPYFNPETASERMQLALSGRRKINIFRMIANADNCGPEVLALGQKLSRGSSLDPVDREIVILRVAHHTQAAYQWHEHTTVARRVGLSDDQVNGLRNDADGLNSGTYSSLQRDLIKFTDAVVKDGTVSTDLFQALYRSYGESKIVELVLLIGFYMMVGRVMNTFELELETEDVGTFTLRLE